MFRLSNGFFILLKNLSGGCHNEVDAPETGLNEARGLCPDAPGFLNLIPGIWTSAHPPQENTISHAFQRSKIFLFLKEPTNDAKVRERDFVCFVFFVGKLGLTKNLFLFHCRFFYSKNDGQHLIYLFYKYEVHFFLGIFGHLDQIFLVSFR